MLSRLVRARQQGYRKDPNTDVEGIADEHFNDLMTKMEVKKGLQNNEADRAQQKESSPNRQQIQKEQAEYPKSKACRGSNKQVTTDTGA